MRTEASTWLSVIRLASIGLTLAWGCGDDSMTDAGTPVDAPFEVDGGVQCTGDDECDDGLFCNGSETCFQGLCILGASVQCSDGIACTVDTCDELADQCVSTARDNDGDGSGDATCTDGAGMALGDDCDDENPDRFPGNVEVCDEMNVDEDCDPETFGSQDVDVDGFVAARCCNDDGAGGMNCGRDCDDTRLNVNPTATEACDGVDNDCNGMVDDGVLQAGFADGDRDGWGADDAPMMACPGTVGFATQGGDCADDNPARNPGQLEICDMADNDCDPDIDEDAVAVDWYADVDMDGFGDPDSVTVSCTPVAGSVLLGTDCDDANGMINPAAVELCDGIDNDCSGAPNFAIPDTVNDFEDDDGDGIADIACGGAFGRDCDDTNPATGLGSAELCDGQDNDCDDNVDEGVMTQTLFRDVDGDGFGSDVNGSFTGCGSPMGFSARGGDCNDGNAMVNPDASEICNALDDDCNGLADDDPGNPEGVCGCNPGFLDCDGQVPNGCETYVSADVMNCGACGNECSFTDGLAICSNGRCLLAGCDEGFFDCDFRQANGCETDIESDVNNCGFCGERCDDYGVLRNPDGSSANRCDTGACVIDACALGFEDCNTDPYDGCEVDTQNEQFNCGGCGNYCNPAGTDGAMCNAGACELFCRPDRGDCDFDPSTGCEEDLFSNDHCGACGNACPMGSNCVDDPTFGGPVCQFPFDTACPDGTIDCNRDATDGCEVSLSDTMCGCPMDFVDDCTFVGGGGDVYTCESSDRFSAFCGATACGGGRSLCDGACFDTLTDFDHCGGCNMPCGGGEFCNMGTCETDCGGGPSFDCDADGFCDDDTNSDPMNCGGCGNVCSGGVCNFGVCDPPDELSRGGDHSCARYPSGAVVCWGANDFGQLGDGTTTVRPGEYVQVDFGVMVQGAIGHIRPQEPTLAVGQNMSCAVVEEMDTTIAVYCWGGGSGNPTKVSGFPAVATPRSVSVGVDHACAIAEYDDAGIIEERVYCWGDNTFGQLGTGDNVASPMFAQTVLDDTMSPFLANQVSAGGGTTCAIPVDQMTGGEVRCWGAGTEGQIGNSMLIDQSTPRAAPLGPNAANQVQVSASHVCARDDFGQFFCWGSNLNFQYSGDVMLPSSATPIPVGLPNGAPVLDFMLGLDSTCVLFDRLGVIQIQCRGANFGQNLQPGNIAMTLPNWTMVIGSPPTGSWQRLSTGTLGSHYCAESIGGARRQNFCWGSNISLQAIPDGLSLDGQNLSELVDL